MNSRNNGSRPLDPYEAQYQQQLEQFSRLAGDTDGEVDLNPGSIDDAFAGYEQQYAQQSPLPRDYGAPHGMAGCGRPQQNYGGEYGDMYGRSRQSYDGRSTHHREQQSGRSQQNYGGE
ncbi:MAG TPA: transcriptional regulator, partial [Ruminococcus sp.]|nr:transcriptional regulator [Ruminococcus sp.]